MGSQSEKLNIVIQIWDEIQTLKNRGAASANCLINVVDLDTHYSSILFTYLSFEPRERWQDDQHFEFFFIFVSPTDSLNDGP